MTASEYPVEEFLEHVEAMRTVAQYETVRRHYAADSALFHVGLDTDYIANSFRVQDYFAQIIPDLDRRRWITTRFLAAMSCIGEFLPAFERAGLAEPAPGEGAEGYLIVAESVLRAAHQILIVDPDWESIPTAEPIIALARTLEDSSG